MNGVSEYIDVPRVDFGRSFKVENCEGIMIGLRMWEEKPINKKRGPRKRKTVRVWAWHNLNDIEGE